MVFESHFRYWKLENSFVFDEYQKLKRQSIVQFFRQLNYTGSEMTLLVCRFEPQHCCDIIIW